MSPKRQAIIDSALELFCRQGFKATGVDVILKKADVAKMTLYHHFPSKEDLIRESLSALSERLFAGYQAAVQATAPDALGRLAAILGPLRGELAAGRVDGCPFVKAAGEFPEAADPIHALATAYKARFLAYFEALTAEAGLADPAVLARAVQALFEGAMVLMQVRAEASDLDAAEDGLRALLKAWPRQSR